MKIHLLKHGESIEELAQKYEMTEDELLSVNPNITRTKDLPVGTKVKIPTGGAARGYSVRLNVNSEVPVSEEAEEEDVRNEASSYVVKEGDDLWTIVKKFNVNYFELQVHNPHIEDLEDLQPGMELTIPLPPAKPIPLAPIPAKPVQSYSPQSAIERYPAQAYGNTFPGQYYSYPPAGMNASYSYANPLPQYYSSVTGTAGGHGGYYSPYMPYPGLTRPDVDFSEQEETGYAAEGYDVDEQEEDHTQTKEALSELVRQVMELVNQCL